jgi:hypothetical protein
MWQESELSQTGHNLTYTHRTATELIAPLSFRVRAAISSLPLASLPLPVSLLLSLPLWLWRSPICGDQFSFLSPPSPACADLT